MASITDNYLPKYQNLINETMSLSFQAPSKYGKAIELYLKSLESEFQSYIHFKNYLLTGNLMENETSVQLLSDALRYEAESFAAFKSVSKSTNDGNTIITNKSVWRHLVLLPVGVSPKRCNELNDKQEVSNLTENLKQIFYQAYKTSYDEK